MNICKKHGWDEANAPSRRLAWTRAVVLLSLALLGTLTLASPALAHPQSQHAAVIPPSAEPAGLVAPSPSPAKGLAAPAARQLVLCPHCVPEKSCDKLCNAPALIGDNHFGGEARVCAVPPPSAEASQPGARRTPPTGPPRRCTA